MQATLIWLDMILQESFAFWFFIVFHPINHKDSFKVCLHCMEATLIWLDMILQESFAFWFFIVFHPIDTKDSFKVCLHCMEAKVRKLNWIFSMLAVKRSVGVAPEVTWSEEQSIWVVISYSVFNVSGLIWGIHGKQGRKHASEGSRADFTRSPKQGYKSPLTLNISNGVSVSGHR